jgi:nitroreductase
MDVKEAIETRRAYRSLDPVTITKELIDDLAHCAQLSPSCSNNQPWRFVFVYDPLVLKRMHEAVSKGNEWVHDASMIVAVVSKRDFDCIINERQYYQFDCGIAIGFLILRATELGLVAHPIAGYSPKKTREILGIPDDFEVITLVNIGKHAHELHPVLTEKQRATEIKRPERYPFEKFVFQNSYSP